ncbi:MAG TPA: allantoate amidohydrolase [Chitinophaga sp.]|nr:allantoate amidohydrolase [Chitinophaga sp.]
MDSYLNRAGNILNRIAALADISEETHCITRTFGTPAFMAGCSKVLSWMQETGLNARIDNIGNVRGRWQCSIPGARTLVIASHIDTVRNAGKFDGPLGVLLGLDIIAQLKEKDIQLPFNIELIAFSDEEGVRFHTTYLGSTVLTGKFDETLLNRTDASGITLQEAIRTLGGDPAQLPADALLPDEWLGYFEAHIEQGPVLYERQTPVAVVTGIAGQIRMMFTFAGMSGHAGTVPMHMRQDALCAAAACILTIEQYALEHKEQVVATTGILQISNAASNVIPGEVTCSLDLRSADPNMLLTAYNILQEKCTEICRQRHITLTWQVVQETAPVTCDNVMSGTLEQAIQDAGYDVIRLASGAGHDAVPVSAVSPVCMLFVRCYKGISHHPQENVEAADLAAAIKVTDFFIHRLTGLYNHP